MSNAKALLPEGNVATIQIWGIRLEEGADDDDNDDGIWRPTRRYTRGHKFLIAFMGSCGRRQVFLLELPSTLIVIHTETSRRPPADNHLKIIPP